MSAAVTNRTCTPWTAAPSTVRTVPETRRDASGTAVRTGSGALETPDADARAGASAEGAFSASATDAVGGRRANQISSAASTGLSVHPIQVQRI